MDKKKRWRTTGLAHIKTKYHKLFKRSYNIYFVDIKKSITQETKLIFPRFMTVKEASKYLHRLSIKKLSGYLIF